MKGLGSMAGSEGPVAAVACSGAPSDATSTAAPSPVVLPAGAQQ